MIHESVWFGSLTEAERRELTREPSATIPRTADFLVIGGGIVGLAITDKQDTDLSA
jgi:hypothetical protein